MLKLLIFVISIPGYCCSQITLINTGTSANLAPISIIDKNIIVHGMQNYSAKSYDECNSLIPMAVPGPPLYWNYFQRLDTSISYILSTDLSVYNSKVYKTLDDGNSWILKLDTPNYYLNNHAFFDSLEGIEVGTFGKAIRTIDGGNSWFSGSHPLTAITAIKIFGDSTICIGGADGGGNGRFYISKDRGNSWLKTGHFGSGNPSPRGFFFLNKDTIIGASSPGFLGVNFAISYDAGNNWSYAAAPLSSPNNMLFKNRKEGYLIGANLDTIGIILKTTDLGKTWSEFKTGIKTQLLNIGFLNDSIALVSGTNGVLFKWNNRTAIFTGIAENDHNGINLNFYPNPVHDKLHLEFEKGETNVKITISDILGRTVFTSRTALNKGEIDFTNFSPGVYFVRIDNARTQRALKVIKE
jgi:hypothetical protein